MTIAGYAARTVARIHKGETGIANIGAIFILVAVVLTGAMFAYALTNQGALASLRLRTVTSDGLVRTDHVVVAPGPVYVQDKNGDRVIDSRDTISLDITVALGGTSADLATLSVSLITANGKYTVTPGTTIITGNADSTLELGETAELRLAPLSRIAAGEEFSIEIKPADGLTSTLTVSMPHAIDPLMTLY